MGLFRKIISIAVLWTKNVRKYDRWSQKKDVQYLSRYQRFPWSVACCWLLWWALSSRRGRWYHRFLDLLQWWYLDGEPVDETDPTPSDPERAYVLRIDVNTIILLELCYCFGGVFLLCLLSTYMSSLKQERRWFGYWCYEKPLLTTLVSHQYTELIVFHHCFWKALRITENI